MRKKIGLLPILTLLILIPLISLSCSSIKKNSRKDAYPLSPVNFWEVKVSDPFWAPRMEINRKVTIPYLFRMNEETGRVDNFRIAAGLKEGKHTGKRYNDSDVYKAIEAACYALKTSPDPELKKQIDELIAIIAKAQEPDGYLFTTRTINPENPAPGSGSERWSNLRVSHELYNLGHLYEAAAAHYLATGEESLLNISLKSADLLVNTFGPDKKRAFPGHQEVEIGLIKLYQITKNRNYLNLAKFFLDERGHYHGGEVYPASSPFHIYNSDEYLQNHQPVLEQTEAVGHAVRATYMYCGLLDVAVFGGWPEYAQASKRLWEDVITKKLYLTGGIGASGEYEAFGPAYYLPNDRAYAETCAAVGNTFWNYRLFLLEGNGKYIDVLERTIYNGLLSGVGLSGDCFFYPNPLASSGDYQRSSWFEVACCPANIARFLATFPQYIYAHSPDEIYINLFVSSSTTIPLNDVDVKITQKTNYPWEGKVKIIVEPSKRKSLTINLRIPGWAQGKPVPSNLYRYLNPQPNQIILRLNDQTIPVKVEKGYVRLTREWIQGDTLELLLPLSPRRVIAHEKVTADQGKVAVEYGPVVYCAEGVDNGGKALNLVLPDCIPLKAEFQENFLGGVVIITGEIPVEVQKGREKGPNRIFLIPYCTWANREPGEMAVWLWRKPPD